IENHIRKNETFKITSTIQTSGQIGMFLLDDHLLRLVKDGKIDEASAIEKAQNAKELREKIQVWRKESGQEPPAPPAGSAPAPAVRK
ncbi:MAG TPA: hypothetical protein VFS92_11445, partial [Planctomycetota bacterium]|nr:hypothetical protein [Planctomycetota bacterium]